MKRPKLDLARYRCVSLELHSRSCSGVQLLPCHVGRRPRALRRWMVQEPCPEVSGACWMDVFGAMIQRIMLKWSFRSRNKRMFGRPVSRMFYGPSQDILGAMIEGYLESNVKMRFLKLWWKDILGETFEGSLRSHVRKMFREPWLNDFLWAVLEGFLGIHVRRMS